MVHVARGRAHKMLAFEPTAEPLLNGLVDTTSIITVNTTEASSSNSSSSSPSPSSSNASVSIEPVPGSSEIHCRELHIIAEEPHNSNSSPVLVNQKIITQKHTNNISSSNAGNGIKGKGTGQQQGGKMNQNRDGTNGNANFLVEQNFNSNSNHNSNMNKSPGGKKSKSEGLTLISHGLTDSVCESLKLLDNENENVDEAENKVFTEEIVITSNVKKTKTGIMKTTSSQSYSSSSSTGSTPPTATTNKSGEEWNKQDYIMEEGSINESNDSEDLPLLPSGDSSCEAVSSIPSQFGTGDDFLQDSITAQGSSAAHKLSKLGNGSKQVGSKR